MCRIVLLDDHRVVMESFANLLATSGEFEVVGMATDRLSLEDMLKTRAVDLLVTDLVMPSVNSTDLIRMLKGQYPTLAILVLSGSDDPAQIRQAMQAGANGFVTKTADKTELFDALRAVATGRRYMDTRVILLDEKPAATVVETPLTEREAEVARLILDELSSNQIAERLFISFNTVETHRKRIYQKLGITTALGLMKYALQRGAIRL
ncbi:response regulator [Larkinella sp. VNQ87]|uniref:response regulator n=1 Tax=Larkinella sp. VNQ87 TaxID=3400921 RepID=UPI003C024817